MFATLLESRRSRQWRFAGTTASVAFHTAVIAAAVVTGASARPRLPADPKDPPGTVVWIPPISVHPIDHSVPRAGYRRSVIADPLLPPLPSKPFVYHGPHHATVLAEPDLLGGVGADSVWLATPGRAGRSGAATIGEEPANAATVDRVAALLSPPKPRYPEVLRAAAVTGRVVVRLVVDTLGRVEPATISVLESSHDLFTYAVRGVIPSLRFRPAEAGGRKVRMLVELPFEFRLNESTAVPVWGQ